MRTIKVHPRKCGRLKAGGVYLVGEPGDGILPLWTPIDPPIWYEGNLFRSWIAIAVELLLNGVPYPDYLADTSAERIRKEKLHEPEIERWGMPLGHREAIGVCRSDGLGGLLSVCPHDIGSLGLALRALRGSSNPKNSTEIPKAFRLIQEHDWQGVLASLWRFWNNCAPSKRDSARPYVRMAMINLGAREDALEVK